MSKIDCKIAENFLKEWDRMCEYPSCNTCPLRELRQHSECLGCWKRVSDVPVEAIAIVQKWSDEHPVKTVKDDFLEKFPNAFLDKDGIPTGCIRWLGYRITCPPAGLCTECWNKPLSEVQK